MLASVMSSHEAEIAIEAGADIIDLKDPRAGTLGALDEPAALAAIDRIAGRRPVSATAGDMPMRPEWLAAAVARTAGLGVDYVKVGFYPPIEEPEACLDAVAGAGREVKLVVVLFADLHPDFTLVDAAAERGFAGVMLDTADKQGGSLRTRLDDAALGRFVAQAHGRGLLAGLAGSLGLDDIPPLLALKPDYLGFRSALTRHGRSARLDAEATRAVRAAIPVDDQPSSDKTATAAAGAARAAPSRAPDDPDTNSEKSR